MSNLTTKSIAQADAEALYLGNLKTVEFDLKLPQEGSNGSSIKWESTNKRFLADDGTVTQPMYGMGSRDVKLIAVFRNESDEADFVKKTYTVHILEEANKIKIKEIRPISIQAECGKAFYLPSVAIVTTEDEKVIAHPVVWQNGTLCRYPGCGQFQVEGFIAGTEIPVYASISVKNEIISDEKDYLNLVDSFQHNEVKLEPDSIFYDKQAVFLAYILSVNDDQMLYNFRYAAGLDTRNAPEMIGWDTPDSLLRGHTTGHYLSALALCYEATGNEAVYKKAIYMLTSLRECQIRFSEKQGFHTGFLSGYSEEQFDGLEEYKRYPDIWAPYYTLHKILNGIIDCYKAFQSETAEELACELGMWVYNRLSKLSHDQIMTMWGLYIAGEYGGMNDVMAQLYIMTGKPEFLAGAKYFDNDKLFYPMEQKIDTLEGLHANQHIPQIIGALRIFEATGEKKYYHIAKNFWNFVVEKHSYVIGGTGESEMFHAPGRIAGTLSEHNAETCCSYNMLKLSGELFKHDPNVKYMDYYERTMTNHILSSGDMKATGASTYFMPLKAGYGKEFDIENSCCHGTGMENHFRYAEYIYYHDDENFYINLFISSRVIWKRNNFELVQSICQEEDAIISKITFLSNSDKKITVRIRKPYWSNEDVKLQINGDKVAANSQDGYYELTKKWKAGDEITFAFPCSLRLESTQDNKNIVAVCWGPYVLAALSSAKRLIKLETQKYSLRELLVKETGKIAFRLMNKKTVFVPLCMINKEKYQVYMER